MHGLCTYTSIFDVGMSKLQHFIEEMLMSRDFSNTAIPLSLDKVSVLVAITVFPSTII